MSLERISQLTGIPRSTVHSYLNGVRLPPPDALDAIVLALGAAPEEVTAWAEALERVANESHHAADIHDTTTFATPLPRQLPACPHGFVGRYSEVVELDRLVRDASQPGETGPVVTVTGAGGVGKTALVLHWAHSVRDQFPDGQLWVDLRGYSAMPAVAASDAIEQMLRGLGIRTAELPDDMDARAALFRSAVTGTRVLIVLDNARTAAQVRPLLPGDATVATVITSRDALRSLAVREGAARLRVEPLARDEALSLLTDRLAQDAARSAAWERIADRCAGLPLALRIARERLFTAGSTDVERFADQLDRHRPDSLEALDLGDSSGDLSVRQAISWSYGALEPRAADAFRHVPLCLAPTFDLHCMSAVLGGDRDQTRGLLDALVAASLLDTAGGDQYRVHDLVATFADERLRDEVAKDDVRDARVRLLRFLCAIAETAVAHTDRRPMRAPWPDDLEPLPHNLGPFGEPAVALKWIAANVDIVAAAIVRAADEGPSQYSWLLAERAWRSLWLVADQGRIDGAVTAARVAAIEHGAAVPAIVLYRLQGITLARRGQLDEADTMFADALALADEAGAEEQAAMTERNRAVVWSMRGEVARAIEKIIETAPRARTSSDQLSIAISLGELELQRGDVQAALHWLTSARDLARNRDYEDALHLEVDVYAVAVDLERGQIVDVIARLDEIDNGAQLAAKKELLGQAAVLRARALRDLGHVQEAEAEAARALSAATTGGFRQNELAALCILGDVIRLAGRPDHAVSYLDRAVMLARTMKLAFDEAYALVFLARAQRALGQAASAQRVAVDALAIADASGYRHVSELANEVIGTKLLRAGPQAG